MRGPYNRRTGPQGAGDAPRVAGLGDARPVNGCAFERRPHLVRSQERVFHGGLLVMPIHQPQQHLPVDVRATVGRPDERQRHDRGRVQPFHGGHDGERAGAVEHVGDQRIAQRLGLHAEPVRTGRLRRLRPAKNLFQ